MRDYALKATSPSDDDVPYIKRYVISLVAVGDNPVTELRFKIEPLTLEDGKGKPGYPAGSTSKAKELVDELLTKDRSDFPLTPETPLDFDITKKCMIALKLSGPFWEFDNEPIRTKKKFNSGRYYGLDTRQVNGKRVCALFCAKKPRKRGDNGGENYKHQINIYVKFTQIEDGKTYTLPVILDPDIENKGDG